LKGGTFAFASYLFLSRVIVNKIDRQHVRCLCIAITTISFCCFSAHNFLVDITKTKKRQRLVELRESNYREVKMLLRRQSSTAAAATKMHFRLFSISIFAISIGFDYVVTHALYNTFDGQSHNGAVVVESLVSNAEYGRTREVSEQVQISLLFGDVEAASSKAENASLLRTVVMKANRPQGRALKTRQPFVSPLAFWGKRGRG
jgi:hypothetical protein